MSSLVWGTDLLVGVAEIDEQHRRFVDAVNGLGEVIQRCRPGQSRRACADALAHVENYVQQHFAAEEALMRRIGYPGLPGHQLLHREFANTVAHFKQTVPCEDNLRCSEFFGAMVGWCRDHVRVEDQKYAAFMRSVSAAGVSVGDHAAAAPPEVLSRFKDTAWDDSLTAFLLIDPVTHAIVDINPVGVELFGRPREAIVGHRCNLFICSNEVGACPITDCGFAVDRSERKMLTSAGEVVPIIKTVRRVTVDGRELLLESFVDITQLKATQGALQRTQHFIRSVIDGIGDPVLVIDPADYRIVLANRTAIDVNGGMDPAAAALRCFEFSHQRETPCAEDHGPCPLQQVVLTRQPLRVTHVHGGVSCPESIVEINATPVFDERGEVGLIIETNRDITEHKRAEQAIQGALDSLERQYEDLRREDTLKDTLIGGVSHELKSPVAKYAMQLEVLKSILAQDPVYEKVRDILAVMDTGVQRQKNIIRNVLMLSQQEIGGRATRLVSLPLRSIVQSVLADVQEQLAGAGFTTVVAVPDLYVVADQDMLWQVLSNIVGNAVKYRTRENPRLEISVAVMGGSVVCRFSDNGIGFSAEERDRAFDRYYQATPAAEGLGLGLNLARIFVGKMGGTIAIESPGRNKGCTVVVTLSAGDGG